MFHWIKTWLQGHPVWQRLLSWGSFILVLIGLGGLPDDLATWQKWLSGIYAYVHSLFTDIFSSANFWRWLIFIAGMLGWLVSSEFPTKLVAKFSKWFKTEKELPRKQPATVDPPESPQAKSAATATGPPLFPLTEVTITTGSSADGSTLTMGLENTSAKPIKNCRLLLTEMQLWSSNLNQFLEFSNILLPIVLPAPKVLEPEDPQTFDLIVALDEGEFVVQGAAPVSIGSKATPMPIFEKRSGVWRLNMHLLTDGRELTKELFFSWNQGLQWANDPRGPLYVTGKAFEKPPLENPLKIEFQTSFFRISSEGLAPLGLTQGNRTTYWVEIVNSDSHKDVNNVAVEVKKVTRLKETGEEDPKALTSVQSGSHRLKFSHSGAKEIDFPPNRREQVNVVSATDAFTGSEKFRIEGNEVEFFSPQNTHKITLELTAKNLPAVTEEFLVNIDPQGRFQMVQKP